MKRTPRWSNSSLISSDGDASAVIRHDANAIEAATAANIRQITFTSIVDTDELSPFYFSPVYRDAERRLAVCSVPSTILRCGLYSDFILKHWLVPSQTINDWYWGRFERGHARPVQDETAPRRGK